MSDRKLKPLSNIRVLDFTTFPPGAAASVMLADLGAEVIRIEPVAQKGRPSLVIGQIALSRGKKSLALDLRSDAANDVLLRLAGSADIVLENAKPGAMEARGFGYRQARIANPGLIWCAITGFGQDGPYADRSGHDLSYLAHSGLLAAMSSDRNWHPELPIGLQASGLVAVVAVQAALIQRSTSGRGAFIDTSISEAAEWFLTCGMKPLSEKPFALPASPDRRLYRCADGRYLAVACAEPRTWNALCTGVGAEDLADTLHKWSDPKSVETRLETIFGSKNSAHWIETLVPLGAAATLVNYGAEVAADDHVIARASVADVDGTPVPASPIRITSPDGNTTGTAIEAPRIVGDDTRHLLADVGYSEAEIAEFAASGII